MIELSPLDVRKKKEDFDRSLRGYDRGQVDSFLDVVADRLESLVSERRELRERVSRIEQQLSDFRDREGALNEALLAAQEMREEARSQAERDAELRVREAESRAEEILGEARREARDARSEIERLHRKREQLLHSLRAVLDRFRDELDAEEDRLEDERRSSETGREAGPPDAPPSVAHARRSSEPEPEPAGGTVEGDTPPDGPVADADGAIADADGAPAGADGAIAEADGAPADDELSLLPEDEDEVDGPGEPAPAAESEGDPGREGGGP